MKYPLLNKRAYLIVIITLLTFGCSENIEPNNAESSISESDSKIVEISTSDIPYDIKLEREVVFESNEDIFIDGYIGEIAIDSENRVYITATMMGTIGIYIFEPDGKFITKFGQEGRGPGEFESISSVNIQKDKIYVFGPRLQKYGIFSTDNLELIKDQVIRRDSISMDDDLAKMLRVGDLYVTESGEIFSEMRALSRSKENEIPKLIYHKISEDGYIQAERILELEKFRFFFGKNEPYPLLFPFVRTSRVDIAGDGSFYSAWTEDFTINKHDREGNFIKSFQLDFKNVPLDLNQLRLSNNQKKILSQNTVPETWQAINALEIDDDGRIWVSTVTERDSTFLWWVIDNEGKLLAQFEHPGKRKDIPIMSNPVYKIKDGYFYERERDVNRGIERIVKYRVEWAER